MGRGRRTQERPEDWNADFVLAWMREHPEESLQALLNEVAPRCGPRGVLTSSLQKDIAKWRREDREFSLELRRLNMARTQASALPLPKYHDRRDPDWRMRWAEVYLQTRNHRKASEAAGLDRHTCWRKRRPGDSEFDQEFYDVYCGCLEALKEHYEDVLHWSLEEAELQGDPRTAGNLAITVLERVDKAKWTRAEDRNYNGTQNVNVTVELGEGAQKALRHAEVLSGRLAQAIGPGPAVIDVPSRVVEKEAVR